MDAKITALDANTTPASTDLTVIVDDPGGTPATQKMTVDTLDDYLSASSKTLTNKTLTSPILQGLINGWTLDTDAWIYVSASSFKVEGKDVTTTFTKGTRLKFTNTTVKYAVVTSSSFSTDTTINIAVNDDYALADAVITSPYYSYQLSPQGYPTHFNFKNTVGINTAGGSLSDIDLKEVSFWAIGNVCYFNIAYQADQDSATSIYWYGALPIAPDPNSGGYFGGGLRTVLSGTIKAGTWQHQGNSVIRMYDADATTIPIGDNKAIFCQGFYTF